MISLKWITSVSVSVLLVGTLFMSASVYADTLGVDRPDDPGNFEPQDWTADDNTGSFFDLTADVDLEITGFSAYSLAADSGSPGDPFEFELWIKEGSYEGSEEVPGDWTLLETISGVDADDLTMEDLTLATPYLLESGKTMGFAIFGTVGGYQWYDKCNGQGSTYAEGVLTLDIRPIRGSSDRFNDYDSCKSFAGMVHFGEPTLKATSVPTLSEYSMMLLVLMLGLMGLYRARATV